MEPDSHELTLLLEKMRLGDKDAESRLSLSGLGFAALVAYYFDSTNTAPGLSAMQTIPVHRDAWHGLLPEA